jgi:hypothetical protein
VTLAAILRSAPARGLRFAAWTAAAALLAFHGKLLVERLVDGSLVRPAVALQWAAALALSAWLVALRRRGVSLFHGRRALALWVLILLLHAVPAIPGGAEALQPGGGSLLLVAPLGLALAGASLLVDRWRRRRPQPVLAVARRRGRERPGRRARRSRRTLVPRAPPA